VIQIISALNSSVTACALFAKFLNNGNEIRWQKDPTEELELAEIFP